MAVYKLLAGTFTMWDPSGNWTEDGKRAELELVAGDTIETDEDLVAKHGRGKFMLVQEDGRRAKIQAKTTRPKANQPNPANTQHVVTHQGQGVDENQQQVDPAQPTGGMPKVVRDQSPNVGHTQPTEVNDLVKDKPQADPNNTQAGVKEQVAKTWDEEYGPLEDKTVQQLKDLAAQEEIDLDGARNKAEIIEAIRKHTPNPED